MPRENPPPLPPTPVEHPLRRHPLQSNPTLPTPRPHQPPTAAASTAPAPLLRPELRSGAWAPLPLLLTGLLAGLLPLLLLPLLPGPTVGGPLLPYGFTISATWTATLCYGYSVVLFFFGLGGLVQRGGLRPHPRPDPPPAAAPDRRWERFRRRRRLEGWDPALPAFLEQFRHRPRRALGELLPYLLLVYLPPPLLLAELLLPLLPSWWPELLGPGLSLWLQYLGCRRQLLRPPRHYADGRLPLLPSLWLELLRQQLTPPDGAAPEGGAAGPPLPGAPPPRRPRPKGWRDPLNWLTLLFWLWFLPFFGNLLLDKMRGYQPPPQYHLRGVTGDGYLIPSAWNHAGGSLRAVDEARLWLDTTLLAPLEPRLLEETPAEARRRHEEELRRGMGHIEVFIRHCWRVPAFAESLLKETLLLVHRTRISREIEAVLAQIPPQDPRRQLRYAELWEWLAELERQWSEYHTEPATDRPSLADIFDGYGYWDSERGDISKEPKPGRRGFDYKAYRERKGWD